MAPSGGLHLQKDFCAVFFTGCTSEEALRVNRLAHKAALCAGNLRLAETQQCQRAEMLIKLGRAGEALPLLAAERDDRPGPRARRQIVLASAHLQLSERAAAHDYVQQAYQLINAHQQKQWRRFADGITAQL